MGILEKAKELFERKNDIVGQHIELKVCMMGPRAVGKTTILTSIFHDADRKTNSSRIYFNPANDLTRDILERGESQLSQMFREIPDEKNALLPGIASSDVTEFRFKLGLKGGTGKKDKNSSVDVVITDFPGEYVEETHVEHHKVINFIKESQVILLAIDTVHLMEEEGKFNEARNRSQYMCEKISQILKRLSPEERKLILLVPLKCEKYVLNKQQSQMDAAVASAYSMLIHDIENNYKSQIGVFITPIQTIGSVVFDSFERDKNGEIILEMMDNNCPRKANFKFYRVFPDRKPIYMPAYCIQPLYYLIAFALEQYKYQQNHGGAISVFLKGVFGLFSSDLQFKEACRYFIANNIITSGNGFVTINNPQLITQ